MVISNFIKKVIYLCTAAISLLLIGLNIIYINNIDNTEFSNIGIYKAKYLLASICVGLILIVVSYFINRIKVLHKYKKALIVFIFVTYGIMQIIWIMKSVAIPFADSEQVLIISRGFLGREEMIDYCYRYLEYYPQQITLSAIFSFIFIITRTTNYIVIQYINVIFNIISMMGIYAIVCVYSKRYTINKVLFFMLIITFIPIILLSTFIYGDFIGLSFAIWSVYFAIKKVEKSNIKYLIFSGITICIACLVRMNYIIFAIAVVIYWLINTLDLYSKKLKKLSVEFLSILVFVSIILIPNGIVKNVISQKYELSTEKSFSTVPYILMGISEGDRGFGWYSGAIGERVYHLMCDEEDSAKKVSIECNNDLRERINFLVNNPKYTCKFYIKKIITMWSEPTYEYAYYNSSYKKDININEYPLIKSINQGRLKEIIKIYQKGIILIIFIGTAYISLFKFKIIDKELLLLMTIFIGGFVFHLLWEAKSRYIIPYIVVLIPVATVGITDIIERIKSVFKRRKNA